MKLPLLALLVLGLLSMPTHAQDPSADIPTRFEISADSGVTIPAQIEVVSIVGGQWMMPAPLVEEKSDEGFHVSYPEEDGARMDLKLRRETEEPKDLLTWNSPAEKPDTFILLSLIFPVSSLESARLTSGDAIIDFSKIVAQETTRTSIPEITEFTLSDWEGKSVSFLFTANIEAQAIVLGDNLHVRVFLTARKDSLPENGEIGWTAGL